MIATFRQDGYLNAEEVYGVENVGGKNLFRYKNGLIGLVGKGMKEQRCEYTTFSG